MRSIGIIEGYKKRGRIRGPPSTNRDVVGWLCGEADLEHAIGLMAKHRALEDTVHRARHYGAIAKDALAAFPAPGIDRTAGG